MSAPRPTTLARLELARAIGGGLVAPLRYLASVPGRGAAKRRVARDVAEGAGRVEPPPPLGLPMDRPVRVFLSAAEASGEIHAASLVGELRRLCAEAGAPAPELSAIGSDRLRALGIEPIADPVTRAHMGFDGVLQSLPYYVGVLRDAGRHARDARPDVFLPVDSPALHVPMARVVRRFGPKVVHLVAPQYWAWAPWRVKAYRRAVDLGLTILPHEPAWFGRHGVATRHVGHPLLDALADTPASTPEARADSRVLALLPGSRAGVIRRNLPWMLRALGALRERHPEAEVRVLQATDEHAALIAELIREAGAGGTARLEVGELHAQLARSRAAFAVSGTILTDCLHHRLPAVVVYRVKGRVDTWMYRNVLTCPFFASTNLLAGHEVVPEHCFSGEGPLGTVAAQVADVFGDDAVRARMLEGLGSALERLGPAGAITRAAHHALALASGPSAR